MCFGILSCPTFVVFVVPHESDFASAAPRPTTHSKYPPPLASIGFFIRPNLSGFPGAASHLHIPSHADPNSRAGAPEAATAASEETVSDKPLSPTVGKQRRSASKVSFVRFLSI